MLRKTLQQDPRYVDDGLRQGHSSFSSREMDVISLLSGRQR
jgi:hypothetical protein